MTWDERDSKNLEELAGAAKEISSSLWDISHALLGKGLLDHAVIDDDGIAEYLYNAAKNVKDLTDEVTEFREDLMDEIADFKEKLMQEDD